MESKFSHVDMRSQVHSICRDYLQGSWKKISQHEMILKHISGGLSNHLYYCALPASIKPVASEPADVLVRFYGQVHGEGALESLLGESVIFALLSERKLGPRLYGVFPGGRLEQYIPARCLNTDELSDPHISNQIAVKMAKLHSLHVPISKEPTWIWNCMERWIKSSEGFLKMTTQRDVTASDSVLETLRSFNYDEELSFARRLVNHVQSPVVFCHNDMQEGNILLRNGGGSISERLSLIDFEYCSYNYRGFDIANHFCEWMYCYKVDQTPYFSSNRKAYPDYNEQLRFIRKYMSSLHLPPRKIPSDGKLLTQDQQNTENTDRSATNECREDAGVKCASLAAKTGEKKLLEEVRVFEAASHLMWAIWSIVQSHVSKIPFGYLEYALVRMEHYQECKNNLKKEDLGKRETVH